MNRVQGHIRLASRGPLPGQGGRPMSYNKLEHGKETSEARPGIPGHDPDPLTHEVIELVSDAPLPLRLGCVCCGRNTSHQVRIDTSPPETPLIAAVINVAMIFVPFGGLVGSDKSRTIKIPYCWLCRIRYIFPAPRTLIPMLGFFGSLAFMAISAAREDMVSLAVGMIMMFLTLWLTLRANRARELQRNPLEVEKHGQVYYYLFLPGGAYHAWAAHKARTPPPLPRNAPH